MVFLNDHHSCIYTNKARLCEYHSTLAQFNSNIFTFPSATIIVNCILRRIEDKAGELAEDLVKHGFINPVSASFQKLNKQTNNLHCYSEQVLLRIFTQSLN